MRTGGQWEDGWYVKRNFDVNPFERFVKDQNRLVDEYGISPLHAACYLCNYEDSYICHTYNGGCSFGLKCHNISESERQKREEHHNSCFGKYYDDEGNSCINGSSGLCSDCVECQRADPNY